MAICSDISLGFKPGIPSILQPGSFTAPTISIGTPGITCCAYSVPQTSIQIPIPIPGFMAIFMTLAAALDAEMEAALVILDAINIPVCNL